MGTIYKDSRRPKGPWSWRVCIGNQIFRGSTFTKDKDKAIKAMEQKEKELKNDIAPVLPKILLLDIETSPMLVYVWGLLHNNYISPKNIRKDWSILTWAAKFLFDDKIYKAKVNPKEAHNRDDKRIIPELWKLFEKSDIIIAHNGDSFDIRRSNTRFMKAGLGPPSPYQTIDTKKVAKKNLYLSSYSLDYISDFFGYPGKIKTDFDLWKDCVQNGGDAKKALKYMQDYNVIDVVRLEEIYLDLRPWIRSHPNVSLYMDCEKFRCSRCGTTEVQILNKPYFTTAGQYDSFRCLKCGGLGRSRYTNLNMNERKNTLISTAR
jgi:hypothetical protein